MDQLREIRTLDESLGDFTDFVNPEMFDQYPFDTGQTPREVYGRRRRIKPFQIVDVEGRELIVDGRPQPGFELLFAAHAELAAIVAVAAYGGPDAAAVGGNYWVSRHGYTQSRFATLPSSDDGILWLSPFDQLRDEVLADAQLGESAFVPDGLRVPVKRAAVDRGAREQKFAAIAEALREHWPAVAQELAAGNGSDMRFSVTMVNASGLYEVERNWIVTPVGAVVLVYEKPRMFRADTFIEGVSLDAIRREIELALPSENDRADWERLAVETAADRVDTPIPD